jgi:hypothetical protein
VKLERVNGTRNHDDDNDMEDDGGDGIGGDDDDVDADGGEGSGSGSESDDGEEEFEDDAANLQAFEEARQRQRKYAHVSGNPARIRCRRHQAGRPGRLHVSSASQS